MFMWLVHWVSVALITTNYTLETIDIFKSAGYLAGTDYHLQRKRCSGTTQPLRLALLDIDPLSIS